MQSSDPCPRGEIGCSELQRRVVTLQSLNEAQSRNGDNVRPHFQVGNDHENGSALVVKVCRRLARFRSCPGPESGCNELKCEEFFLKVTMFADKQVKTCDQSRVVYTVQIIASPDCYNLTTCDKYLFALFCLDSCSRPLLV